MSTVQTPAAPSGRLGKQAAQRKAARAARAALSDAQRVAASAKISDTVARSHWFRSARSVACYLPMHDEVDTWLLIACAWRMKKRIFAPVSEKKNVMQFREITPASDLYPNEFGFSMPRDGSLIRPRDLDLVLTPLAAFDAQRNRVGMGGGYYDRAFAFLRHRRHLLHPKLVGLAFACQRVEKIVPNPWDIRLFRVIDESC